MIVCVLFPHFAASVVGESDQPLIIGGYPWQRKTVYAASLVARRAGIEPGMTLSKAWLLCPEAQFIPADEAQYRTAFEAIILKLSTFTHRLEPESEIQTSPACYLDMGNLKNQAIRELVEQIQENILPYTPAIGIASNKFTARVAAALGEAGSITEVPSGKEAQFLSDIAVNRLRLNKDMTRRFRLLGIRYLSDLAKLPKNSILTQFGEEGMRLYELAHGHDNRPLIPRLPDASLYAERGFDAPIDKRDTLGNVLGAMAGEIAEILSADMLGCSQLTLKLITEDYTHHEHFVYLRVPLTQCESLHEQLMILLDRMLLRSGVTDIMVIAGNVKAILPKQLALFPDIAEENALLENIGKHIQGRHKSVCVFRVRLTDEVLPEERYQLVRVEGA